MLVNFKCGQLSFETIPAFEVQSTICFQELSSSKTFFLSFDFYNELPKSMLIAINKTKLTRT